MYKVYPICTSQIAKTSKQWKRQIYCSDKCRKVAHRKTSSKNKRIEQRRANMRQNEEVLLLVRQCKRAKTVQILKGHDAISLTTTMALVKNRPKLDVNLCHIAPVKGKVTFPRYSGASTQIACCTNPPLPVTVRMRCMVDVHTQQMGTT
jgi:hypothetical protein